MCVPQRVPHEGAGHGDRTGAATPQSMSPVCVPTTVHARALTPRCRVALRRLFAGTVLCMTAPRERFHVASTRQSAMTREPASPRLSTPHTWRSKLVDSRCVAWRTHGVVLLWLCKGLTVVWGVRLVTAQRGRPEIYWHPPNHYHRELIAQHKKVPSTCLGCFPPCHGMPVLLVAQREDA